uniref:Uncharacterized protein n=2 Tax=viral metagenome TaxID=1070528 RepID=A0A6M3IFN9_9ZZZZ
MKTLWMIIKALVNAPESMHWLKKYEAAKKERNDLMKQFLRMSAEEYSGKLGDTGTVTFIRSGYRGVWIKVFEDIDYTIFSAYANIYDLSILKSKGMLYSPREEQ